MSDSDTSGFGKFVPGFDFLQNLAKGASSNMPQMPNLGNWVAPTLNEEELDKRIEELKNVHFWLEQNSRALSATIQALEVQKMTLSTLKGMNFNIGDMANALNRKVAESMKPTPKAPPEPAAAPAEAATEEKTAAPSAGMVDPMQLWGSLTAQFQQIAASAVKEIAAKTAEGLATTLAKEKATASKKATATPAKSASATKTARKTANKTAAKTTRKPASRG
jgi:hypothetical protein